MIKCLCLPAHSTHLLQPLDVVIFGRLAAEYSTALGNASRRGITGVDKELFMQLFQEARKESSPTDYAEVPFALLVYILTTTRCGA
jgi:hypothetical protein